MNVRVYSTLEQEHFPLFSSVNGYCWRESKLSLFIMAKNKPYSSSRLDIPLARAAKFPRAPKPKLNGMSAPMVNNLLGAVPQALYVLDHFRTSLGVRYYYWPHLTDEDSKAYRG